MSRAVSTFLRSASNHDTVIILLGWAGAKDDHLEKYSQLYTTRGYDIIRFTADLPESWHMSIKYSRDVSAVVPDIKKAMETKDIALHVFSMNGVYTLCSLNLQFPELGILQRAKGIIFDSAPVSLGVDTAFTYMQVLDHANADRLKNENWLGQLKYKLYKGGVFAKMMYNYSSIALAYPFFPAGRFSGYDYLSGNPEMPHILYFVYSDADTICPGSHTARFAEHQRKTGHSVKELHFKDSPHVLHFRQYPKEYTGLVDSFLEEIRPRSRL